MIEDELDATRPYRYSDYDGESLTLTQQNRGHGPFVTADYEGQGPVIFGGTDDVLRFALALILRGADKESAHIRIAVDSLRAAVEAIEDKRKYKRGQEVEVYDARDRFGTPWGWRKGEVMGYYDDDEYAILPERCGVYISYGPENIRELQGEN